MGKPNVKKMKAKKDVEGLIEALKNKDWYVRAEAAGVLGGIEDARAVEPLIQALKDKDEFVREVVAMALKEIRKPAVKPHIEALKDENKYGQCAKCHGRLSESIEFKPTSPGMAILAGYQGGGFDMSKMMSKIGEKFSLAVYCKKCGAYYCAGCALETWQKTGKERFICPECGKDLGSASKML